MKFRQSAIVFPGAIVLTAIFACALIVSTFTAPVTVTAQNETMGTSDKSSRVSAPAATFPGTGVGAIPDSAGGPQVPGAPLDITFAATGLSGAPTNVEVSITLTHTWVGDLKATLIAPNATQFVIYGYTGATTVAFGSSSDLAGTYNYKDSAAGTNWWTAAITNPVAAGDYRTTLSGPTTTPAAVTNLTAAFSGIPTSNGTWILRITDGGSGDTGTVTAATLTLTAGPPIPPQHIVDFDGDGKTDPAVVRNTGGGPSGQLTWFIQNSGGAPASTTTPWGLNGDRYVPEDYDGDGKTDIAVWRAGPPFGSYFYILQSGTSTLRIDQFGQTGDDPTVIGDYDGDNKSDPAVYRGGAVSGAHSFWYYRSSVNGLIIGTEYGQNGDFPAPGDYDGDGKNDFVVQRNNGGGQARFFIRRTTAGETSVVFGTPTDNIVPGDYDGDGKTDIATARGSGGQILWNILRSSDSVSTSATFGGSATDFTTQGDWDGDGKTDIAVWRPNVDPTMNFFYILRSGTGTVSVVEWGSNGDYPVANYNRH